MKRNGFGLIFCILLVAQILLLNFGNFSQYLTIFFLPVMILCIPTARQTVFCMLIAFISGFAVDFLAGGALGLTSLALVPVGLLRLWIISTVFGSELLSRGENISVPRQGAMKILIACFLSTAVFLIVYIWADGAGTRPFWFNAVKFLISVTVDTILSFFICDLLTSEEGRWK